MEIIPREVESINSEMAYVGSLNIKMKELQRGKLEVMEKDVRRGQEYKSRKEKAIARILVENDIPAFYEPITLELTNGRKYPPDFITGITSGGNNSNLYFIEQHSMGEISSEYIIKLKNAGSRYMMNFILISDANKEKMAEFLSKENVEDFVAVLGEGNIYWSINCSNYTEVEEGLKKLREENTVLNAEQLAARISSMKFTKQFINTKRIGKQ